MACIDISDFNYSWKSCKPMPTKRVFATAVQVQEQLFVIGGCDARGTPVDNLESYNPSSKKNPWSRWRNMPTPRAGVCSVAIGDKLLTFGGINVRQEPVDVVEIYDTSKKEWVNGVDKMIERLLGLSAVVKDDKVVVVGGMGFDTNPKDYIMMYNPVRNLWESLPPMPTPRYATFSFLIDNRLYVLGGRQGKTPVVATEAFDFRDNKWQQLENIPNKRVFSAYVSLDNQICSLGGLKEDANQGFSDLNEILELRNGKWRIATNMNEKRGDFAAAVMEGKVIVAGGLGNGGKPMENSEVYNPVTDEWQPLPTMPSSHCSCAHTCFNNELHIVGGLTVGGPSAAMEAFKRA